MTGAYYNEFDPHAAAWLRELIKRGLIADGEVDGRSIVDVRADDLRGFTQCHWFAGIAGWSYALRLAGWPDDKPVWTGSCPCQPFSAAGKRGGTNDERHLWPEFYRLIRECEPPVVFGEQVASADAIGKINLLYELQRGKGRGLLPSTQSRWQKANVPRLRELIGETWEAMALGEKETISGEASGDASRLFADGGRAASGEGQGDSLRSGLEEHSAPNRCGVLRDDRHSVRFVAAESLECAVARSDKFNGRLHPDQYEGGSLFAKHNGKRLGDGPDPENRGRHTAWTVREIVERIVSEDSEPPETEDGSPWIDHVSINLVGAGYTVGTCVAPACSLGSPHIRQRLYFVGKRLADADHARSQGRREPRVECVTERPPGPGGMAGRLANTMPAGWPEGRAITGDGQAPGGSGNCGLADADGSGPQSRQRHDPGVGHRNTIAAAGTDRGSSPTYGFWRDADWLFCRDGKWRPTQPAILSVADGLPGVLVPCGPVVPAAFPLAQKQERRVMRLRGYGNAIVPQVAAAFIEAAS